MSQQIEGNTKTFATAEALNAFCRVKLDSSADVVYADAGEDWIGTTEEYAVSGADVAVRLRSASGTRKMLVAGAVSIGDIVYGADDGEIDDAPTGEAVGRALEAATADGDIIEILTVVGASQAAGDSVEVIGGSGGITALNLVYVSDQTDNVMTVLKAQGTSAGRFADYICPNAIGAAAKGAALKTFLLSAIDTSDGSVGDPVYLSDSTAGGYVLVKPTATDKVQIVGRIVEDHATTGAILFDLSGPQQVVHDHSDASEGGGLTSPQITTGLNDANGCELLLVTATGSAVNELTLANAATGASPSLTASGETSVGMDFVTKGTGVGALVGDDTDIVAWQKDTNTKLGFFAATPAVQQAHITDAVATGQSGSGAEVDALGAVINSVISVLETFGLTANS